MAKEKRCEITVATVFDSKKDIRQAFVELILHKRRGDTDRHSIDAIPRNQYTQGKVFSDVRA